MSTVDIPMKQVSPSHLSSDDELVAAIQRQDRQAFEILVRRYQPLVLQLARRFLGDGSEARDVVQETFLALWDRRYHYEDQGRFRYYLTGMVLNRCKNIRRAEKVRERKVPHIIASYEEREADLVKPCHAIMEKQLSAIVWEKLQSLSIDEREALILRHMQGYSLEEIVEATGHPLGTVKSYLSRGLKKLQNLCKEG